MKIFKNKMIYFIPDEVKTIEEALVTSLLPLINNEYVFKNYLDKIIQEFLQDFKEFILNDQVLILKTDVRHELCIKNGISLAYFSKPIKVGNSEKIQFILAISATSENSQSELIEKAKNIFSNEENLRILNTQETLQKFINKLSSIEI